MTSFGGGFSFTNANRSTSTTTVSQSTVSTAPSSSFGNFGQTSTPGSTTFVLTPPTTTTTSSLPTLNFGSNTTALNLTTNVTSSTTVIPTVSSSPSLTNSAKSPAKHVSFSFGSTSTTPVIPASKTSILRGSATNTTVTNANDPKISVGDADKSINYIQLHDLTTKLITDFEDLQKTLMNQTIEMNNRDIILSSNEDKIEKLVESVKTSKSEQTQVKQQLDFILSQQKDLEECLTSLEDEVSSYFPELPADDMYKLAENIDSRLKKTLETSKEIITKINDKNRSSENITNPMVAIGHILNHLTNSIQMLENLNSEGQSKLNELQRLYQQFA